MNVAAIVTKKCGLHEMMVKVRDATLAIVEKKNTFSDLAEIEGS